MRIAIRFLALIACIFGTLAVLPAGSAAAAGPECGPGDLTGVSYQLDGGTPVDDLGLLGPLTAGSSVTVSWTGSSEACADAFVTLAAHRTDTSPVDDLVDGAATCQVATCGESLTYEVPARSAVCSGVLVAATSAPVPDLADIGGDSLGSATIDNGECAPAAPSASAALDCSLGSVQVLLENDGELDATFDIAVDGQPHSVVEVGPRTELGLSSVTESLPVVEDTFVAVVVSSDQNVLDERRWLVDCHQQTAQPSLTLDCALGGARLDIDNFTDGPVSLEIVVDGVPEQLDVNPFTSERMTVPLDEDVPTEIVVNGPDGELLRQTVVRDCEVPSATASVDCLTGSVAFDLANDGESMTLIDLLVDGRTVVGIPVPPRTALVARLDLGEGPISTIGARSKNASLFALELPAGCRVPTGQTGSGPPATFPDEVLTRVLSNTDDDPDDGDVAASSTDAQVLGASLARTGSDPTVLVLAAGTLLSLGGWFLMQSGRRLESEL